MLGETDRCRRPGAEAEEHSFLVSTFPFIWKIFLYFFVPFLFLFISMNGAATLSSGGSRRPALAFHVGLCRACPWSGTWPRRLEPGCCLSQREPQGIYQACSDRAKEALGDNKQSAVVYYPNRRSRATRSRRATSHCTWLSPAGGWTLTGCARVAVPPRALPRSPPGGLEMAVGDMWRVRDPRFPGPEGGLCAQQAGGTGHVEHHQGLPRAPWDHHRAARRAPPCPHSNPS